METATEVEKAQDKTLEDVEEMDDMRMGVRTQSSRKTSAPASLSSASHMLHTAKGERRFREKVEREGVENLPADEQGKSKFNCVLPLLVPDLHFFPIFRVIIFEVALNNTYIFFSLSQQLRKH